MGTTTRKTGEEYELLTKQLLEALSTQTLVETTQLDHLKTFRGTSSGTSLTIDIWWEFVLEGRHRCIAFQCKNWGARLKQEHVYAFAGALRELPGNPRGVMVAKTGYQRGARRVAEANGITALEFRAPTDRDWEGRVRDIYIKMITKVPAFRNVQFLVPENAADSSGLPGEFGAFSDEIRFTDGQGNEVSSLPEIIKRYLPEGFEVLDWRPVEHRFDQVVYLDVHSRRADPPRLPLVGISFEVSQSQAEDLVSLKGDDVVAYILKDALREDLVTIGPDLSPRPGQDPLAWLHPPQVKDETTREAT